MGAALTQAQNWLIKRGEDLPLDREFIAQSIERRRRANRRGRIVETLTFALLLSIIMGMFAWLNEASIHEHWRWFTQIRPYRQAHVRPFVLSASAEHRLKPGDTFKECDGQCPEMLVVPAGEFVMGSPEVEHGHDKSEEPQHKVVLRRQFAVAKFPTTFSDWDACVAYGSCDAHVEDSHFGRGRRPVINVNWDDAKRYVSWLSQMTGKPYRLLSEAEFEYALRAGTETAYAVSGEVGMHANCRDCSSQLEQTMPVGSLGANPFGLYDMPGNVNEWVADCMHESYQGAPDDGSAWTTPDCHRAAARGGSWADYSESLRSSRRNDFWAEFRAPFIGFRVARTLSTD